MDDWKDIHDSAYRKNIRKSSQSIARVKACERRAEALLRKLRRASARRNKIAIMKKCLTYKEEMKIMESVVRQYIKCKEREQ